MSLKNYCTLLSGSLLGALMMFSCAKKTDNPVGGVWVIILTQRQAYEHSHSPAFKPFGFDFYSADSVEVFCKTGNGLRFSSYKTSRDTCRLSRSDSGEWWTFKFARNKDTLIVYSEKDTLRYHHVSLEGFKVENLKRIDVATASWNTVSAASFLPGGVVAIRQNGYDPDSSNNFRADKIYFRRAPVSFWKVSHNFQKMRFIAASDPGRKLLDTLSEVNNCSDGEINSILLVGDSIREVDYHSCSFDYTLFQYNKYVLAKSFEALWDPTDKMISYDSMVNDPIVFCGHIRWGKEHDHELTLSEQAYLSSSLRIGKRISGENIPPMSIPMYNDCGSEKYSRKIVSDGRIFRISTSKGEYYVDIGFDFFETVVNDIDKRKSPKF